jgi:hypothetical protein
MLIFLLNAYLFLSLNSFLFYLIKLEDKNILSIIQKKNTNAIAAAASISTTIIYTLTKIEIIKVQ